MRRWLALALILGAVLFFLWEAYAAMAWVIQAGGIGPGFHQFWRAVQSDWMVRIVVSDHLVIAGVVLIGLWLDTARRRWSRKSRMLLALAFVVLGSPTLLGYLAGRLGKGPNVRV
jgi:dipeptide/tripeptide permease